MQKYSILKKICKNFSKKNKSIIDIIVFGSFARKKEKPGDIDIAVIAPDDIKTDELEKHILDKLGLPAHISLLKFRTLFKETLWKTIIHEGISLLDNKKISKKFGFESFVLFWYNLIKLKASDKVRFSYAMFGRDGKGGVLKKLNGKSLGKGVLLVPVDKEDEIRDLFFEWGLPFERRRILIED